MIEKLHYSSVFLYEGLKDVRKKIFLRKSADFYLLIVQMRLAAFMDSDGSVVSALTDFDNPVSRETLKSQKKITNQNVSDSEESQLLSPSEMKNKTKKKLQPEARGLAEQEVLQQEYLHLAELEKNLARLVKSKEGM